MELFNRNPFHRRGDVTSPAFTPVAATDSEAQDKNWLMLAALALAALALAVILVVGGSWVVHKLNGSNTKNTSQSLPAAPPQDLVPQNP